MNAQHLRRRFEQDAIATASPARLVTMLYDRLVRDLHMAEAALAESNVAEASAQLMHAQDIVTELRSSLDVTAWAGARDLSRIYGFLLTELISANVRKDVAKVVSCRGLVEPLRDAWHQAASLATSTAPLAAAAV